MTGGKREEEGEEHGVKFEYGSRVLRFLRCSKYCTISAECSYHGSQALVN